MHPLIQKHYSTNRKIIQLKAKHIIRKPLTDKHVSDWLKSIHGARILDEKPVLVKKVNSLNQLRGRHE